MEPTETKNRRSQKVPPMMGTHPQRERADQGAGPLANPLVQDIAADLPLRHADPARAGC